MKKVDATTKVTVDFIPETVRVESFGSPTMTVFGGLTEEDFRILKKAIERQKEKGIKSELSMEELAARVGILTNMLLDQTHKNIELEDRITYLEETIEHMMRGGTK